MQEILYYKDGLDRVRLNFFNNIPIILKHYIFSLSVNIYLGSHFSHLYMKTPVPKFFKDKYFIVCAYSSYGYYTLFIYYSIPVGI